MAQWGLVGSEVNIAVDFWTPNKQASIRESVTQQNEHDVEAMSRKLRGALSELANGYSSGSKM
jgi:hypothetical protein